MPKTFKILITAFLFVEFISTSQKLPQTLLNSTSKFLEVAAYRAETYKNHFPTGYWLGVKELALPEFMIEIELEVHKSH